MRAPTISVHTLKGLGVHRPLVQQAPRAPRGAANTHGLGVVDVKACSLRPVVVCAGSVARVVSALDFGALNHGGLAPGAQASARCTTALPAAAACRRRRVTQDSRCTRVYHGAKKPALHTCMVCDGRYSLRACARYGPGQQLSDLSYRGAQGPCSTMQSL